MITLTPPLITHEHIDYHITCIRPKRQGGARIESEIIDKKLVIHNYGHGGFGWSLLPGSVQHSINLLETLLQQNPSFAFTRNITIIGAGCFGLLTALLLNERGWNVTVVAEYFDNLTSHKAAGSLAAVAIKASSDNQPLMDKVAVDSYIFYKNTHKYMQHKLPGITPIPVYMIHVGTPNYRYPLLTAGVMPSPEFVDINFGTKVMYTAKKFDVFFIDTQAVMADLISTLRASGISLIQRKVNSFSEIQDPIIFNCAGLGARAWDAQQIIPVQGHLVKLKNQPAGTENYMLYAHVKIEGKLREISWTPRMGGLLGASVVNYEERLDTNAHLAESIIEYAQTFFEGATYSTSKSK